MPVRRHSEKFRRLNTRPGSILEILTVWAYIEAADRYLWLPSAFDSPRGRPYEIICKRVYEAWRKSRDVDLTDVAASIEKGGERDWPNLTPELLNFPRPRVRHRRR
jgi:hypothetical protein